jgi:3-oxoacyl-[acyl-carrier-protein] synthase-3
MASNAFSKAAIRGVVSAVPKNVVTNQYFEQYFSAEEIAKTTKMGGVLERRWADPQVTTSDLCKDASIQLMKEVGWKPETVDCLIFVSQTVDYHLPASACLLHGWLGLSSHCAAFDVKLGCSGYVYGLWLAASLIHSGAAKRVLLLAGDTCSRMISEKDRSTGLLFGDAGTATAVEYDPAASDMHFVMGSDGRGAENLIVPGGCYRTPSKELMTRADLLSGISVRQDTHLYMDGAEIFNFTIEVVGPLIKNLLNSCGLTGTEVDYFLLHQANEFMLKHIAKKLKLDLDRVPLHLAKYGNTSSASIPLLMTTNIGEKIKSASSKLVLAGFGVGYSWGATFVDAKPLSACSLIEV